MHVEKRNRILGVTVRAQVVEPGAAEVLEEGYSVFRLPREARVLSTNVVDQVIYRSNRNPLHRWHEGEEINRISNAQRYPLGLGYLFETVFRFVPSES